MLHRIACVIAFLAGCGGSSTKPEPPGPRAAPREEAQLKCQAMMTRQRDCTDAFIPALVGWRVELDVPAGVAETDRTSGREALVAKAKEEWAASNSDEQLGALCTKILGTIPDDQLPAMTQIGERCSATRTCEEFVACVEPAQRQRLAAEK